MAVTMYLIILGLVGIAVFVTLVGVGYARTKEEEARQLEELKWKRNRDVENWCKEFHDMDTWWKEFLQDMKSPAMCRPTTLDTVEEVRDYVKTYCK